ncbi:MAG: TolC family protein [Mariprofundaceae bacterium]|nr:TolC family protein [Mariprofundaceae bacterium]
MGCLPCYKRWIQLGFAAALFMSSWHVALAADDTGHLFNNAQQITATQLVKAVLVRNPGLSAMRSAEDAASAVVTPAGSLDDPTLAYTLAPRTIGGYRTPGGKFRNFNQSITLSQAIPWPGTLDLRGKIATAEAESVTQKLADFRLQLAERTRAAYAQWYYVHQALAVNRENQTLVQRLRKVAETAYSSGQAPQQDVLQAEVELIRLQNQALEIKRRRTTVQARINGLLNRDPQTLLAAPLDLPLAGHLPDYAGLQKTALAQYPALKRLDAEIAAGQARVDLARKGFYPDFKLSTSYNSLWDAPEKQVIVGASINIPISAKHQGELDAVTARLAQSRSELLDARANLLSNVDQSYQTAAQAKDSIALYTDRLLPLARLNLKAAESDYSGGNGDFLKVITAEQQYLTAKLELARTRADFYTQLAALDYQTGGALTHMPTANQTRETKP